MIGHGNQWLKIFKLPWFKHSNIELQNCKCDKGLNVQDWKKIRINGWLLVFLLILISSLNRKIFLRKDLSDKNAVKIFIRSAGNNVFVIVKRWLWLLTTELFRFNRECYKCLNSSWGLRQKTDFCSFVCACSVNYTNILWAAFFVQNCSAQLFSNYSLAL